VRQAPRLAATLVGALLLSACHAPAEKAAGAPAAAAAQDAAPAATETGGFDGALAFAHLEKLLSFGPRPPGSEAIRREQVYIKSQLESFGCAVEEDNFHASTPIGSVAMRNLVAEAPGSSPKSGIILLLTHADTLRLPNFIGADDSASSTALMLEMARLLCPRKQPLAVWIAFLDGEEAFVQWSATDGTYGSRELAAKLELSGQHKRIRAVILADMIGDRQLDISRETNSTRWLTDLVWQTAARLGYRQYFLDDSTTIQDDHIPFVSRGVPAVDVIDLDYPYWHTPQDTLDKVSAKSIAIVGHVILETIVTLEKKFS